MNAARMAGVALTAILANAGQIPPAAPPEQPLRGPGGKAYAHATIATSRLGSGAHEVYLFEPADPTPERAPVVVFGHGWGGVNPNVYGAWIAHLVRRGFTVIFPRYQADLRTPVRDFTTNALAATTRGLDELRTPGHVPPDERGLAFVGHSMGGLVVANLAVRAAQGDLPRPLALMVVEPGRTWPEMSPIALRLEDLSVLPSSVLLLAVVGDDDEVVGDIDARKIYTGAIGVARANRDYVRIFSDDHGTPRLVGDHSTPTAPAALVDQDDGALIEARGPPGGTGDPRAGGRPTPVTDALDYYGTWKLLDGLTDAVFRGVHREYALGNTPEQRFMGRWSDGVPVRELIVREP